MSCRYFPACQGCSHWNLNYAEQKNLKLQTLRQLFKLSELSAPEIEWISCGESGLRSRVDFTIQRDANQIQQMGFYDQEKNILAIDTCLQLSPALQNFFNEFQKIQFPIQKGSVRLRVSPRGKKGCWLDFSNLDIKKLLDDAVFFDQLIEANIHVEVGQKGKHVRKVGSKFKLFDPEPHIWFETYAEDLKPLALKGLVSDFTQPSWTTAQKMIEVILKWSSELKPQSELIEFGPGLGQFTLPLLAKNYHVNVFESDASATTFLELNARENQLDTQLKIHLGDYQNKSIHLQNSVQLALVNPPRSGLKKFSHEVIRSNAATCIYISCFPESMVQDLKIFKEAGYEIRDVKIIDQFPQTKHFETCVLLQRINF